MTSCFVVFANVNERSKFKDQCALLHHFLYAKLFVYIAKMFSIKTKE